MKNIVAILISSIVRSGFVFFYLHVNDVDDLHQLLSQQFALPVVAPQRYRQLAEFLVPVGSDVQTINVVGPSTERTHDLYESPVPVLDQ